MVDKTTLKTIKTILFKYLDPKNDKAFIFGSWAIGDNRKFSDIDIGVESKRKLPDNLVADIKDAFEESDLPYTVDVLDFSTTTKRFRQVAKQKVIKLN